MADKQDKSQTKPTSLQATIAGGFAGLSARLCIAPLDVVKINMQLQTNRLEGLKWAKRGIVHQTKGIYKEFGARGFWRGNASAQWLYLFYGGSQFFAYDQIKRALAKTDLSSESKHFISGAVAGTFATVTTYPFDILRTRFAAQSKDRVYTSVLDGFQKMAKAEGFRGLYTGLAPSIVSILPQAGLMFVGYEALAPVFKELNLPFGAGDFLAGAVASGAAKTAVFPLDLIRKRLQVQGPARSKLAYGAIPEYKRNMFAAGRAILQNEGPRGLYRGLVIGVLKAAPTASLYFWFNARALEILVQNEIFA